MARLLKWVLILAVVILAAGALGTVAFLKWAHGFSARDEPPAFEKLVAQRLRRLSYPRDLRASTNPVPASPEALSEARAHFADHCAYCHGNDGRGQTEVGQRLYPRAPDMTRPDTQSLTDGEIFHVIKYGVRLTGMPAWGAETSTDDDLATWKLVHFIRHLPQISPAELEEMKRLNPRSPQEMMSEEEEEKFLQGEEEAAPAPSPHRQH